MKFDELKAYKGDVTIHVYGTIADADVYLKEGVDDAIAELKARIADLEGLNHDLCERVTENDGIRQHWEEIEQTRAENERLKAKLVEQDAENRRLKRALYKACANWAGAVDRFEDSPNERWSEMKYKCRAMAEKFK